MAGQCRYGEQLGVDRFQSLEIQCINIMMELVFAAVIIHKMFKFYM